MVPALLFWNIPTCYSSATAGLQQSGASVEDAALNLGANSFRSFKDVIIPLLKAPFLSGFVLSFLRSWNCSFSRVVLCLPPMRCIVPDSRSEHTGRFGSPLAEAGKSHRNMWIKRIKKASAKTGHQGYRIMLQSGAYEREVRGNIR